jgi:hypothetical protein
MTMETKRGMVFVALAVLMVSGVLWVQNGLAEPASIDRDGVLHEATPLGPPDGPIVPGSSATLVRTDTGVTMTIHTSGLVPGAVHTVWWFIYNKPDECATDPCTFADFEIEDNPVQATTLYATGHVIGNNGVGNFAAYLGEGDTSGYTVPPNPPTPEGDELGLVDARKAQIQLGVRSHGQPIPGMVKDQISTFNGGCPPNSCQNEQYSTVFAP